MLISRNQTEFEQKVSKYRILSYWHSYDVSSALNAFELKNTQENRRIALERQKTHQLIEQQKHNQHQLQSIENQYLECSTAHK